MLLSEKIPVRRKISPAELESCIGRMAKQDMAALETLYRMTSTAVYAYALSLLRNRFDAEDAMHDSYLQIFRYAGSYVPQGKPMAWILTIVRNFCYKKAKEKSRYTEMPEDADLLVTEDGTSSVENRELIRECFAVLDDTEREILVLHAVVGYKHREIASHLQMPLSTVLSKYKRAVEKLQNRLQRSAT